MQVAACGRALCLTLLGLLAARGAPAQTAGLAPAHVLSLALAAPNVLGVTVTSGGSQAIGSLVDNATNAFPSPVVLQTNWDLNPGQTSEVDLVAFFAVPAQALSGGATQIPSSRILGRMATGLPTTYTAVSGGPVAGVGTSGGSLHLFRQTISGGNKVATRTDNLDLQLNLVGFPTLPVGSYTGTLTIQAVTQ